MIGRKLVNFKVLYNVLVLNNRGDNMGGRNLQYHLPDFFILFLL